MRLGILQHDLHQFLAVAMFPWVLWAFRRTVRRGRSVDILVAGVAYAALALNHNFHAFIFTPVVAVYVLGLCAAERRWTSVWRAAMAGALGLALSAAFWLPALYERQWSLAHEGFYVVRSSFQLRFLSWRELLAWPEALDTGAANPYLPFALGWGAIVLGGLGFLTLFLARGLSREQRYHLVFFALLLAVAVFMVLPVSVPIWEGAPLLATAEFPWRLMGVAALSLAFLAGASLCWLKGTWSVGRLSIAAASSCHSERSEESLRVLVVIVAALSIILTTMVYTYPPKPFVPYGTPTLAEGVQYELATQTIGTTTLGEYLPRWVQERPLTSPMVDDYLAARPPDKLVRSALPEGVTAELLEHNSVRDVYRVSSPQDWRMALFTFYYPGWTAAIDGKPAEIAIGEPRGLIAVPVPAGEHQVAVSFEDIPMRTAANVLSLLAWVLVVAGLVYSAVRSRRGANRATDERRWTQINVKSVFLVMAVVLVVFALRVAVVDPLTPWFRRHSPPGQVIGVQHPARMNFDDRIALLGYDLWGEPAKPGDKVHVRLYWRALKPDGKDFSAFVHLDALPDLTTRAQSDNVHPGDARAQIDAPVRNWTPDAYVRDEHSLEIPADLPPVGYALRVGLYDRQGQRLRLLDESGQAVDDAAFLQVLHVLPEKPPDLSGADRAVYRLGEYIELVGSRAEWQSGSPLRIHLFWRAVRTPVRDYTVFVHVLDQAGKVIAQSDGPPVGGAYPTSWWHSGQIIEDAREVAMGDTPRSEYRIAVGMYDLESGERLEVRDEKGVVMPEGQVYLNTMSE